MHTNCYAPTWSQSTVQTGQEGWEGKSLHGFPGKKRQSLESGRDGAACSMVPESPPLTTSEQSLAGWCPGRESLPNSLSSNVCRDSLLRLQGRTRTSAFSSTTQKTPGLHLEVKGSR